MKKFILLFSLSAVSNGLRVSQSDSRTTGLYQAPSHGSRPGLILTAKPEYSQFGQISFHSLECDYGEECSQSIPVTELSQKNDPDLPPALFSVIEDKFYRPTAGNSRPAAGNKRPEAGNSRPAPEYYAATSRPQKVNYFFGNRRHDNLDYNQVDYDYKDEGTFSERYGAAEEKVDQLPFDMQAAASFLQEQLASPGSYEGNDLSLQAQYDRSGSHFSQYAATTGEREGERRAPVGQFDWESENGGRDEYNSGRNGGYNSGSNSGYNSGSSSGYNSESGNGYNSGASGYNSGYANQLPSPPPRRQFSASKYDRPQYDTSKNDRPHYERPQYERPQYNTQNYETSKYDRPQFGTPQVLETKLGIHSVGGGSKRDKIRASSPASVSVASSLGRVKGPDYPRKPTHPSTQLKTRPTRPPAKLSYSAFQDRIDEEEENLPTRYTIVEEDISPGYYSPVTRKERYDPFSFQSTTTSSVKRKSYTLPSSLVSHVIDSRHSVQEPGYKVESDSKVEKRKTSGKAPIIVDFKDTAGQRRKSTNSFRKKSPNSIRGGAEEVEGEVGGFVSLNRLSQAQQSSRRRPYNSPASTEGGSSVAGYQGGDRPVFVSLSQAENREILSLIPTPPPREYFPVSDGNKKLSNANPYYETTTPSPDQENYWDSMTRNGLQNPPRTFQGYDKVVQDLLGDRNPPYPYTSNSNSNSKPYYSNNNMQSPVTDTNQYIGDSYFVSTSPIQVGPSITEDRLPSQIQRYDPPDDMLSSYSDRYGWNQSPQNRDELTMDSQESVEVRNWTSLDLAKPKWEDLSYLLKDDFDDYKRGEVEEIAFDDLLEEKKPYGQWDETLDILPPLSRSTEPKPKQWVLLSKSRALEDENPTTDKDGNRFSLTTVGVNVDSGRFEN